MSQIKFQNFSGIKNEQHNPRAVAQSTFKNGQAVVISLDTNGKEIASFPTTTGMANVLFVDNVIDKPELDNKSDYRVEKGECVRAFEFPKSELLEVSGDLVATTTVVKGDKLIANASGLYEKTTVTTVTSYLEVVAVTTFMGSGYTVKVVK